MSVSWTPPATNSHSSEVLDYKVYEGLHSGGETLVAVLPPEARTYSHEGLPDGEVRYFRVKARNEIGEGDLSPSVAVRTMVLPSAPNSPATTVGPDVGQITLKWSPPTETGGGDFIYKVYVSGSATATKSLLGTTTQTKLVDGGHPPGTTRFYQISVENVIGEGPRSIQVSGTAADRPGPPAQIASQTYYWGVVIGWTPPNFDGGTPITSYRLYRSTLISPRRLIAITSPTTTIYQDTRCFTMCTYDVTANNIIGESPRSASVTGIGANPL